MSIVENPAAEYDSASELLAADAVQRSWLPTFIPASASRITHVHNLDTSEAWTAFSVPVGVVDSLKAKLSAVPLSEVRQYGVGTSWRMRDWPPELDTHLLITPRASFSTYRGPTPNSCVAIDDKSNRVYVWSCHSAS